MLKIMSLLMLMVWFLTACSLSSLGKPQAQQNQAAQANVRLAMFYLLDKQDASRAKQKLLTAQQLAPTDPMTWYSMAFFYEYTGNGLVANNLYLHALRLAPKDGAAHNNYGTFLCRQRRYCEAVQHFILAANDANYLNVAAVNKNAALCVCKA